MDNFNLINHTWKCATSKLIMHVFNKHGKIGIAIAGLIAMFIKHYFIVLIQSVKEALYVSIRNSIPYVSMQFS